MRIRKLSLSPTLPSVCVCVKEEEVVVKFSLIIITFPKIAPGNFAKKKKNLKKKSNANARPTR